MFPEAFAVVSVHWNWPGYSELLPSQSTLKVLLNLMGGKIQQKHQEDLKQVCLWKGDGENDPSREKITPRHTAGSRELGGRSGLDMETNGDCSMHTTCTY